MPEHLTTRLGLEWVAMGGNTGVMLVGVLLVGRVDGEGGELDEGPAVEVVLGGGLQVLGFEGGVGFEGVGGVVLEHGLDLTWEYVMMSII